MASNNNQSASDNDSNDDAFFDANDGSNADDNNSGENQISSTPAPSTDATSAKRRQIQSIMRNRCLTDLERRLQIQQLMDGSKSPSPPATGMVAGAVSGISSLTSSLSNALLGTDTSHGRNGASGKEEEEEVMACVHYERKCNVVAPCCGKVYGCRVCHE